MGVALRTEVGGGPATGAGERPAPPVPAARRTLRPGPRDPRLVGGVVLVALAVLLGTRVVAGASATVRVLVAQDTLVAGGPADSATLTVREVRLDPSLVDRYLVLDPGQRVEDLVSAGTVALHPVGEGELVPRFALGAADQVQVRPVAVTPRSALGPGVSPGGLVDLWFVPDAAVGEQGAAPPLPEQLAAGLSVAAVDDDDATFGVAGSVTVHVLVPTDELPRVLAAGSRDGSLTVVAVPGSAP